MYRLKLLPYLLVFVFLTAFTIINTPSVPETFKQQQKKNSRVKSAYLEKDSMLTASLDTMGIKMNELNILILATKQEQLFHVYAKKKTEEKYRLFKSYDFCYLSGVPGPKRKEGDLQVPEGFYYVNWFNPNSSYHLAFKINYPNASDKILSDKRTPGGEIFIHGKCCSIGCIPLTDDKINEVYILTVEAKNNGQEKIPVYIFPYEMTEQNMKMAEMIYQDSTLIDFWKNLKEGWDTFESTSKEFKVKVDAKGKYLF